MVAKGANGSKSLEGPGMGVSGVDDPGLSGSGVVAVDEGGDFLGPLVKKALSVLKPEALESLGAVRFDIWKVEVEVQGLIQSAVWSPAKKILEWAR